MDHQLIYDAERICNGANTHRVRTALQQYVGASEILKEEQDEESRARFQAIQERAEADIRKEIGKVNRNRLYILRARGC